MPKIIRSVAALPAIIAFVFLLASMPLVLQARDETIQFRWGNGLRAIGDYFAGFASGETFRFYTGKNEFSFWEQIGGYFGISFAYVAAGAIVGMTLGILFGIAFARTRGEWLKRVVEITGVLPDFVLIILLQFTVVYIAQRTGIVVFKVANLTSDTPPAVALPLLSMIIIPGLYILRNVALQMRLTLTEDYIGNAKARGLGRLYITFFHALPNVLPFVKADLHKFMGILMGNLFVVEYFYNMRGLTKLLFSDTFGFFGYQYAFVVNGLLSLLVLYGILYALLRFFLYGWEKVFVR
ncbi:ABC transporter permease subunit [Paenibacillus sp. TRM 82003]|nr:ABC transporter permease subunit [Paenibacillus sp. TRM 82003]